jgi:hypothetical protein
MQDKAFILGGLKSGPAGTGHGTSQTVLWYDLNQLGPWLHLWPELEPGRRLVELGLKKGK